LGSAFKAEVREMFDWEGPYNAKLATMTKRERADEWWGRMNSLLIEHGMHRDHVPQIVQDADTTLRQGFVELCAVLRERQIPLTIISAGITQIVEEILAPVELPDTHILANQMQYNGEGALERWSLPLLHSESKSRVAEDYPAIWQERVVGRGIIALGDNITDLSCAAAEPAELLISVGFLSEAKDLEEAHQLNAEGRKQGFLEAFDMVVLNDGPMDCVVDLINEMCSVDEVKLS